MRGISGRGSKGGGSERCFVRRRGTLRKEMISKTKINHFSASSPLESRSN